MLTRRIVPCLDVDAGRVVKGVRFEGLRDAGDPVELARAYAEAGADELVFLDVSATLQRRPTLVNLVERVAREIFIPFTVGGGLRDVETIREVLRAGADKIALNTAAVSRPALIREAAGRFGSPSVVVAIDAARTKAGWRVYVRAGSQATDLDAVKWSRRVAELGAGEILLTSIDRDGTRSGFDLELLRAVSDAAAVPVIASGGAGTPEDLRDALGVGGADAVLAASIFHFGEYSVADVKNYLAGQGLPIRLSQRVPVRMPVDEIRFDESTGLVPAIVQDVASGRVLMLGYMDRVALETTRRTGRVTFFSRRRGAQWTKGETSGNWLQPVEIRSDCDGDALLVRAVAHGPTCHTGERSCFGNPGEPSLGEMTAELIAVIGARLNDPPEGSYTARLLRDGVERVSQKVGEEAVELALEAVTHGDGVVDEAADLLYHLLVLLTAAGVTPSDVARELARRRRS